MVDENNVDFGSIVSTREAEDDDMLLEELMVEEVRGGLLVGMDQGDDDVIIEGLEEFDEVSDGSGDKDHNDNKTKDQSIACHECGRMYSNRSNLTNHIRDVHLGIKKFSCPECNYQASQRVSLNRHVMTIHRQKTILCNICAKEFRWEADWRRHVMAKHTALRFPCPEPGCGKDFSEARSLAKHKKVHGSEEKPLFKCNISNCDFKTFQQSILNTHKMHYHEDLLKTCTSCDYKTLRKADLTRHIKSHHSDVAEIFRCHSDDCGAEFKRRDYLRTHILKQHVVCDTCQYTSTSKADYTRHMKKHAKENAEEEDDESAHGILPVKVKVEVDNDRADWILEL